MTKVYFELIQIELKGNSNVTGEKITHVKKSTISKWMIEQ